MAKVESVAYLTVYLTPVGSKPIYSKKREDPSQLTLIGHLDAKRFLLTEHLTELSLLWINSLLTTVPLHTNTLLQFWYDLNTLPKYMKWYSCNYLGNSIV